MLVGKHWGAGTKVSWLLLLVSNKIVCTINKVIYMKHHFTTGSYYCIQCHPSLVPRPHPLTRRNDLVNQVVFLGMVHSFPTV